jgi:hypothetical protein
MSLTTIDVEVSMTGLDSNASRNPPTGYLSLRKRDPPEKATGFTTHQTCQTLIFCSRAAPRCQASVVVYHRIATVFHHAARMPIPSSRVPRSRQLIVQPLSTRSPNLSSSPLTFLFIARSSSSSNSQSGVVALLSLYCFAVEAFTRPPMKRVFVKCTPD